MSAGVAPFELLRFEAAALTATTAVLEVDGVFASGEAPARPRLLVETRAGADEVVAVGAGGSPWSASFAVPLEVVGDSDATFALVPGRGPLIGLPPPTLPEDDRYVRLARTANALRRRSADAAAAAAAAEERLREVQDERDRAAAERDEMQSRLTTATARAEAAEREAIALRDASARTTREAREAGERAAAEAREAAERDVAAARREAEQAAETARAAAQADIDAARSDAQEAQANAREAHEDAERERERRAELDDRLIAAEDEVRHARRELRDTRARLEAMIREQRPRAAGAIRALRLEPEPAPTEATASREDDDDYETGDTVPLAAASGEIDFAVTRPEEHDEGDATDDPPPSPGATAPMPAVAVGEDDDPEEDAGDEPRARQPGDTEDGLWFTSPEPADGESVRVLRKGAPRPPATAAARAQQPARHWTGSGTDDVLDPAAVGARLIEPAANRTPPLGTWPRFIAVGALTVLFLLLVLIFLGVF